MASSVRVILKNPRYAGKQRWNVSKFVRDPETGRIVRKMRPQSEWVVNQDESLRIVSDELFADAERRTQDRSDPNNRLKSGGKPKYLLSTLLRCGRCHAHYVMSDARSYACSSYINGRCCSNGIRVRRDTLESLIVGRLNDELLTPDRVKRFAAEFQKKLHEHATLVRRRNADVPRELSELDARLDRLRQRLLKGDEDLEEDELLAAINRVELKREQLLATQSIDEQVKITLKVPDAAERYRKAIAGGLKGESKLIHKARAILRDLLGDIRLVPEPDGSLWAEYQMRPAVLLRAAGTGGRGDPICRVPGVPLDARLK